jgi:phosphoribosylformylglycinamidine synthase
MTTDVTPRYCLADPEEGGRQAVREAWRQPDGGRRHPARHHRQHEFRQPGKPEILGQFAAAVRGMADACTALDFPVVSGNVSLYNETEGVGILPTPAIGGVGSCRMRRRRWGWQLPEGGELVLVGETQGWLGQSLWLREIMGRRRARRRRSISWPSAATAIRARADRGRAGARLP